MTVKRSTTFAHPQEMNLIVMPGTVPISAVIVSVMGRILRSFFTSIRCQTVGLCYNLQLVPVVPDEPHADKTVDHLLTEAGFYSEHCNRERLQWRHQSLHRFLSIVLFVCSLFCRWFSTAPVGRPSALQPGSSAVCYCIEASPCSLAK